MRQPGTFWLAPSTNVLGKRVDEGVVSTQPKTRQDKRPNKTSSKIPCGNWQKRGRGHRQDKPRQDKYKQTR
jgi:hypothetical protein